MRGKDELDAWIPSTKTSGTGTMDCKDMTKTDTSDSKNSTDIFNRMPRASSAKFIVWLLTRLRCSTAGSPHS